MTRIDNLSRLYELLYSNTALTDAGAKVSRTTSAARTTRKTASRGELDKLVAQHLDGIPENDEGLRRATRAVVESAMIWQFGEAFVESPNALAMVDELETRLLKSDDFQKLMGALLRDLSG